VNRTSNCSSNTSFRPYR